MALPMPPAPRLNAKFFWGYPTCRRAFARPETAARCHRPPEGDPLTVAAPLVRCLELAMFDGHALALTGWLEADQAELTLLHCPEAEGGFEGHRLPVLRVAPKLGTHGGLCVRVRLKTPQGFCGSDDPELRRGGALWIAGLLTPRARAKARLLRYGAKRMRSQPPRMGPSGPLVGGGCQ
jgi:hypothetical protein